MFHYGTRAQRAAALACLLALAASAAQGVGQVFLDGFEYAVGPLPSTNGWQQDDYRNLCNVVSSAADGGVGPHGGSKMLRCNWNGQVAWNDPAAYESAFKSNFNFTNEIFLRWWVRRDASLQGGTGPKIYRTNACSFGDIQLSTSTSGTSEGSWYDGSCNQIYRYWGGDSAGNTSGWHKMELYFKNASSNGAFKYWVDDSLEANYTGNTSGAFQYFYITSNWSGAAGCCDHDTTNYLYWDDFEVWSDNGNSSYTGSMANGDIALSGGGGDTTPPVVSGLLPTGVQPNYTTSVTLQATTDENATCKYNTTDTSYASMSNTFATTGGTAHSQSGFAVSAGNSYTRYVRCSDTSGNANTSSSTISFSVANPTIASVVCTQFSPTQSPGSIPCSSTTNGTPTSYAWSFQSAMPNCSFSPQAASTTLTCQYGANPKPCLTIQPGGSSLCTTATYPFRYNKPSGFGVN